MGDFQKLKVWQVSKDLAVEIYQIVQRTEELKRDFRFASQLTSSSVSISSNIAEGDELKSIKQAIKHFYIAKGSCAELMTQLIIAKEIGVIETDKADELISKSKYISAALYKLIEARRRWEP